MRAGTFVRLSHAAHQIVGLHLLSLNSSGLSIIALYCYHTATGLFHAYRNIGAVSRESLHPMKPDEQFPVYEDMPVIRPSIQ
jgi:hypothetical protein